MTMEKKIAEELKKRIEEAGFKSIVITMKCNGDEIRVTPCGYGDLNWDTVEYFLLDSCKANLYGSSTIDGIASTLSKYEEKIEEDKESLKVLKEHIREHGMNSDWDFVSDYHKDIFGHRPHVAKDKILLWAYSDDTNSARHYI